MIKEKYYIMTNRELSLQIAYMFDGEHMYDYKHYGINVSWSKTLRIVSLWSDPVRGIHCIIHDNKNHYVCEKILSSRFKKSILEDIYNELTK